MRRFVIHMSLACCIFLGSCSGRDQMAAAMKDLTCVADSLQTIVDAKQAETDYLSGRLELLADAVRNGVSPDSLTQAADSLANVSDQAVAVMDRLFAIVNAEMAYEDEENHQIVDLPVARVSTAAPVVVPAPVEQPAVLPEKVEETPVVEKVEEEVKPEPKEGKIVATMEGKGRA